MKQQFRVGLLIGIIALFSLGTMIPLAAQVDTTQLRVGHFVFDAPSVNLYMDESIVMGQDDLTSVFSPMTLPDRYMDLDAGVHTFAIVPDGEAVESAIIDDQEFTLEAGRTYLLAILGNTAADDLHFTLIDETTALEEMDISLSAVSIAINNLYGTPAIDVYFADETLFNNLAYGDYLAYQDPTEGQGTKITAHDDIDSVVFEFPDAVGSPANVFAVFVFSGNFSGTIWEDYTAFYVGQYVGELAIMDAGAIAIGDLVPVEITEMGQRVQYLLTLDADMIVDILEAGNDVATGADAYLRIYDAAGNIIFENDELSMDDNVDGIFDAGFYGLELDAGSYILEAGTFADTGVNVFTLSVIESQ